MTTNIPQISAVPTNIITGFLGVGKTSAILHLLKTKPVNERWAVLVNEFGEIGVDGRFFEGMHSEQEGVFVREVPGGCMCCAAGLPMQVALNQLLSKAKPDRLLIEPTGLGHPKEVLEVLCAEHYQTALDLQKVITLVDARKLSDERYTQHETFNQQIAIADLIVGNKQDLYQQGDQVLLADYVQRKGANNSELVFTQNGEIPFESLVGKALSEASSSHHHDHHHHADKQKPLVSDLPIPESGYIKAMNEGEGFYSTGWRFSPDTVFQYEKLFSVLSGLIAERVKAVFITERGVFAYNLTVDALTEIKLDDAIESCIEIISDSVNDKLETQLFNCRCS